MTVDVALDGAGAITGLTVVDANQLNKERMAQLSGVAQERGKEAAKLAQQGVGALAARMGTVALASAVVVWIAWFFLPAASIAAGMVAGQTYTFWNLLGTDFNNMAQAMGATSSSIGLLGLIGMVALIAPFARAAVYQDTVVALSVRGAAGDRNYRVAGDLYEREQGFRRCSQARGLEPVFVQLGTLRSNTCLTGACIGRTEEARGLEAKPITQYGMFATTGPLFEPVVVCKFTNFPPRFPTAFYRS